MFGLALSSILINTPNYYINNFQIGSWHSCFYVTSSLALLWFPLFYYFIYDSPSEHPRLTDEEYDYIVKGLPPFFFYFFFLFLFFLTIIIVICYS